jgi:hypothetical protein
LFRVLDAVDGSADILQGHRRPVAIGDHRVLVCRSGEQLIVGVDDKGLTLAFERAFGVRHRRRGNADADVLQRHTKTGDACWIDLQADRLCLPPSIVACPTPEIWESLGT